MKLWHFYMLFICYSRQNCLTVHSVDNGFGGDVVLEAKTTKLAEHYAKDFGAVKLPSLSSAAPRFIIADEAAKRIFFSYLE